MNVNTQPATSRPLILQRGMNEDSGSDSGDDSCQWSELTTSICSNASSIRHTQADAAMAEGLRTQFLRCVAPGLNTALRMGDSAEFDRILNMPGINVNMPSNGITPLIMTVRMNNVQAMKGLLAQPRINLNAANMQGNTALHLAAQAGQIEQMDALLSMAGINVNLKNMHGFTPLCIAAQHNRDEAVELLLHYQMPIGTVPGNLDEEYLSAYTQASEWNAFDAAMAMLHEIPELVDVRRSDGHTVLTAALKEGRHDVVEALLKRHPKLNVNMAGEGFGTALNMACRQGSPDMVLTLLRHPGIDPNVHLDEHKTTALHQAASRRNPNIVQALLSAGPAIDVNAEANFIGTPLHTAVVCGDIDTLRVLLARVDDINQSTEDGWTALHFAAYLGKVEAAQFLLQQPQIEAEVLTALGEYPSDIAKELGHEELTRLLTNAELESFTRRTLGIDIAQIE